MVPDDPAGRTDTPPRPARRTSAAAGTSPAARARPERGAGTGPRPGPAAPDPAPVRLVLTEKPSVARDLAGIVDPGARPGRGHIQGRTYTFTWALGHLVELEGPEHYAPALAGRWDPALLPVVPPRFDLRAREGREEQLDVVRGLLGRAAEVIVATDAGREGELIWAYIRDVSAYDGPVRRLWLSENTPAAVRAAFAALREPPAALEAAARARAAADWVVGMNATMALSARHGGLWSAGRVQTPTLALICAREAEIRAFRSEDYHVVLAEFEADGGDRYAGRWFRDAPRSTKGAGLDGSPVDAPPREAAGPDDEPAPRGPADDQGGAAGRDRPADRLATLAEAEAVVRRVMGRPGRIVALDRRRASEGPPRLFHLTDLQRAANARFGMTAAATLRAAQELYERHRAITYPRTDSRHVSREVFGTFPARLRALRGLPAPLGGLAERLGGAPPNPPGPRVVDDAKVTDHHALLPTAHALDPAGLPPDEARVYELVVRRFLAALLPPAVYDETEAVTEVAGETFRSRNRVLVEAGWREAEPPAGEQRKRKRKGGEEEAPAEGTEDAETDRGARAGGGAASDEPDAGDLSRLRHGEAALCRSARAEARQTRPPARYSEATLLRTMETAGRLVADDEVAEAMMQRGLGTPATRAQVIETLIQRGYVERARRSLAPTPRGEQLVALAPPELREAATTGEWEARLRRIEAGGEPSDGFLGDVADLTRRIVADVARQSRAAPTPSGKEAIGVCPRCGGTVVETPKGFGCARWRSEHGGCRWVLWKAVAGKTLSAGQARELLARGETAKALRGFRSRAGQPFEARLRLDRETGRVTFLFDASGAGAPAGAPGTKAIPPGPAAGSPPRSGTGPRAAARGTGTRPGARPGAGGERAAGPGRPAVSARTGAAPAGPPAPGTRARGSQPQRP